MANCHCGLANEGAWEGSWGAKPHFEDGSAYGQNRSVGRDRTRKGTICPTISSCSVREGSMGFGTPECASTSVPSGPILSGRLLRGTLLSSNPT